MRPRDHYGVLDVPPLARAEDIESAYRFWTTMWSASISTYIGKVLAARKMHKIDDAYLTLRNPARRLNMIAP